MKSVALASHVALIEGKEYDGIGNAMIAVAGEVTPEFHFVRHSMEGRLESRIITHKKTTITNSKKLIVIRGIGPLRYVTEIIATVLHFSLRQKVEVYIGIDPLNAFAGIILKKLGRIQTCVFYTPDYSPQRFNSPVLNRAYHAIDRFCVRNADEVWSVSHKIQVIRKKMGLADDKNIFLPNVPPVKFERFRDNKHDKFSLITAGIIDTQLDNENTIRAVGKLAQKYPKLSMTLIGNGPDEERLKKIVKELKLTDKVNFLGRLPLEQTLERVSRAGIGLALYTGEWAFNQYGDSTKCREYFYFGLPVISTDTHATVQDIVEYDAGIVVEQGVDEYAEAIEKILSSYEEYSKNSLELGDKYAGMHTKLLQRLLK